jgi:hypothetical protein
MTDIDDRRYRFIDPAGKEIGAGPLDQLMAYLPDSRARKDAEALIRDAAIAVGRIESINARADAVIERERQVEEREQALREDAIRRLVGGRAGWSRHPQYAGRAQARVSRAEAAQGPRLAGAADQYLPQCRR